MIQVARISSQSAQLPNGRTRYDLHTQILVGEDWVAQVTLGVLFITSVVVALFVGNMYDSGDSILHYLYAHWAWKHPENLLNNWAKPLFTLLAAGPAYFGFLGMKLFQCTIVAWSAWLAYTCARQLRLPWPALAIVFCYAAPDYFRIQYSGLTEPLFGLILVGAVATALHGRLHLSAAVLSCLPLVRSEGIALWGLWAMYLIWEREWRALPWLGLGILVFSLVGGFFQQFNFAWLFTNSPYAFHSPYGSGHWRHFVDHFPTLLGWPLTVLLLVGAGYSVQRMMQLASWRTPFFKREVLLVDGSIVLFTLVQSVLWAYGLFGSFGMLRTMTTLVPLCAVVSLSGLAVLSRLATRPTAQRQVLAGGCILVIMLLFAHDYGIRREDGGLIGSSGNLHWRRDFSAPGDLQVADQATVWLRKHTSNMQWHSIAFEHPYYPMALDVDLFDPVMRASLLTPQNTSNLDGMPVGTYVFWDEFWAAGSGQLSLDAISHDARYRELWRGEVPHSAYSPDWQRRCIIYERVK
jgi:hypothetical protein